MKALDVAMDSGSVTPARTARISAVRWDGLESPWVHAAWAAAPWPAWCLIAALGTSSAILSSGVLALSIVLALMVVWAHRPDARATLRWIPSVIGTGLMGELALMTLSDRGLSRMDDLPRAIATWLVCVAIYEVAPIVAAGSRITPREHRHRALDVGAHLAFAMIAIAAYAYPPRTFSAEASWYASPWIAAVVALPLAAARCGSRRPAQLPAPWPRAMTVSFVPIFAWTIAVSLLIADRANLVRTIREAWHDALGAELGMFVAFPIASILLSMIAALVLGARAIRARHAPSGRVVDIAEDGITIERSSNEEAMSIALESGPMPARGETVTLLGLRERSVDVGPFRDGAPRLVAKRAYAGTPRELARSLAHRAAGWLAWAAAGVVGGWIFAVLLG